MSASLFLALLLFMAIPGFALGWVQSRRLRADAVAGAKKGHHSRPIYHGLYTALRTIRPGIVLFLSWVILAPWLLDTILVHAHPELLPTTDARELSLWLSRTADPGRMAASILEADPGLKAAIDHRQDYSQGLLLFLTLLALSLGLVALRRAVARIAPDFRARIHIEHSVMTFLKVSSTFSVLVTLGILFSLLWEALRFFQLVSPWEFFFGLQWSPQIALRSDQVGASGLFGSVPLFAGTFLVTGISMLVAGPIGLMSAIYLSEFATPRVRTWAKPMLEILAGIPTVVYGFFAVLVTGPFLVRFGSVVGLDVASESAMAAGLVMGIMIIPLVSSLADDVIRAVPQNLREGSLALGATQAETIVRVVLPSALPGIAGAFLLAISRAVGETMIVVMASGMAANLTANPFEATTTITVQIVSLLVGDQEFDSSKTLAAFALGLALFAVTLLLNVIALRIVRKYREAYE
ncbi:MAG: phosphate ABC transporter permease subunit PstC [Magnetococcales bacterium]|nr:phosphate ABC transporter permease subunit PstC [Magnetococcales bacterium]